MQIYFISTMIIVHNKQGDITIPLIAPRMYRD